VAALAIADVSAGVRLFRHLLGPFRGPCLEAARRFSGGDSVVLG